MIVATNRIAVAKGFEAEFEARFRDRARLIEGCAGFIRNEVHRPRPMKHDPASRTWVDDHEEQGYYEVKTWWRSFDDFVAWTKSEAFARAHSSRPPKDMFAGPSKLEIHEVFLTTDKL
jgi:heme-degrading monooxygenase HmoA